MSGLFPAEGTTMADVRDEAWSVLVNAEDDGRRSVHISTTALRLILNNLDEGVDLTTSMLKAFPYDSDWDASHHAECENIRAELVEHVARNRPTDDVLHDPANVHVARTLLGVADLSVTISGGESHQPE